MELLEKLEEKKDDNNFLQKFEETKLNGKRKLASFIHSKTGILVDPSSLFDVQVKRIHQYNCLLYTSPSPRDTDLSRMPSSA